MKTVTIEHLTTLINQLEEFSEKKIPPQGLEEHLFQWSSLLYAWEEASAWAYIAYTCHTGDEEAGKVFNFLLDASEKIEPLFFEMKKNFLAAQPESYLDLKTYELLIKLIKGDVELFRPENVSLGVEEGKLSKDYQSLISDLSIDYRNKTYTLSQAAGFLENPDRSMRKEVWEKIYASVASKKEALLQIYHQQITIRHRQARNAGFGNYRDYAHQAKNRFDYTPEDCLLFHESIQSEVVPLYREILETKRTLLNYDSLRPYDLKNDAQGRKALKPFSTEEELIEKGISVLHKIHQEPGETLSEMKKRGCLDLVSRNQKAPGGYNYPLAQSGYSFIFMNAAGLHRDVITLLHESGHAYHAALTDREPVFAYRNPGMEVAELASMSMELISMSFWDDFYPNPQDLQKAKLDHLEDIVAFFPWMAMVDAFQHEIYLKPESSPQDFLEIWDALAQRFSGGVDWSGLEHYRRISWLRQNHIFTSPFYYVEYGIAQLGALQIWRNYLENPALGFQNYRKALALGGRKGMKEIYEAGNISFDFSRKTLKELMGFVRKQMEAISKK